MLEDLIQSCKISPQEYDLYMLFQSTELGRKCLREMTHAYFMEQPDPNFFTGEAFAFLDGRRSFLREVHLAVEKVTNALKETLND